MSDAGAIGVILEDMIDILKDMYDNEELSEEKLKFGLIIIKSISDNCKEQKIDLAIGQEYKDYIKELMPYL